MSGHGGTTLYYFTGTGNSLACAREMAEGLRDATLVPIAALREERQVVAPTPRVGIVFPVYFYTLPLMVRAFLERLDLSEARYAFLVITMGASPGRAVAHARTILGRSGGRLDAAFGVRMLGNYIAVYNVGDERAVEAMQTRTTREVERIVEAVRAERGHFDRGSLAGRALGAVLSALLGGRFTATCRTRDRRFTVDPTCISCGTCVAVCPAGNVRLTEGRPEWLGRCEQCFACIHLCPVRAIQVRGTRTRARRRYHHPEVTADEIAAQRAKSVT